MTDLTDKWKKGKRLSGCYYIKLLGGDILPALYSSEYILKQFQTIKGIYDGCAVTEVLAPVPSYEEWQEKTKSLKVLAEVYCKEKEKNAKLKNLLKECESSIQYYQETYGAMDLDTYTLLAKLKEALK